ncbi:MAG: hypothetical protein M0C28_12175 [Candidatus Moduliflexus flocculans]|nr:hypothetical protein [Candidatus Moduliflexus flocculans]
MDAFGLGAVVGRAERPDQPHLRGRAASHAGRPGKTESGFIGPYQPPKGLSRPAATPRGTRFFQEQARAQTGPAPWTRGAAKATPTRSPPVRPDLHQPEPGPALRPRLEEHHPVLRRASAGPSSTVNGAA